MNNSITKLFTSAVVAGLLSGASALADDHGAAATHDTTAAKTEVKGDANKCKGDHECQGKKLTKKAKAKAAAAAAGAGATAVHKDAAHKDGAHKDAGHHDEHAAPTHP